MFTRQIVDKWLHLWYPVFMKIYKKGKRIIGRGSNGKFKKLSLNDIGLGCCEVCGEFYQFDSKVVMCGPFVDPTKMAKHKKVCAKCMEAK